MTYSSEKRNAETQYNKGNYIDIEMGTASFYANGKFDQEAMKALQNFTFGEEVVADKDKIGRRYLK